MVRTEHACRRLILAGRRASVPLIPSAAPPPSAGRAARRSPATRPRVAGIRGPDPGRAASAVELLGVWLRIGRRHRTAARWPRPGPALLPARAEPGSRGPTSSVMTRRGIGRWCPGRRGPRLRAVRPDWPMTRMAGPGSARGLGDQGAGIQAGPTCIGSPTRIFITLPVLGGKLCRLVPGICGSTWGGGGRQGGKRKGRGANRKVGKERGESKVGEVENACSLLGRREVGGLACVCDMSCSSYTATAPSRAHRMQSTTDRDRETERINDPTIQRVSKSLPEAPLARINGRTR